MEEHERIELRSDEVKEILGTPPSWLIRWGTLVIVGVLASLGVLSYVVKYPDVIMADVMITTSAPPTSVITRSDGNISKLLVVEKQEVGAGDILAIMQNTSDYQAIIQTEKVILKIQNDNFENLLDIKPDRTLQMGDIQTEYSNFIQALETYSFSATSKYSSINVSQTQEQIKRLGEDIRITGQKKDNAKQRLELAKRVADKNKVLYNNNAISLRELEASQEVILQGENELKNYESQVVSKRIEIGQLESRITEIKQGTTINNTDKLFKLKETVNNLRASIDKWKQTFLLTAPVAGRVTFSSRTWKEQMFAKVGEEILVVVPKESAANAIVGKAIIPIFGSGKVHENQRVIIRLDGYPYEEFGTIDGTVAGLSLVPKEDKQLIQIAIPGEKLVTNRKKEIPQAQQLAGKAQIVTEEKRFIERIFDKILAIFKKNS
jgi:multidrug efflux pump subunit AcrA (membrane-fusion protein)